MTTPTSPLRPRRTPRRLRVLRSVVGILLGALALTGCDFDVYKLPLPGGADSGENPISVTVMFADVLDLVPKSTVKVNDVTVGEVTDVDLDGFTAMVTLKMRRDTELPDNAVATIRQTSLLGEKFVSLAPPEAGASGNPLGDNDVIPLERSGRNPEIEEVLGALSLVLNGGGVAQLKTIAQELNLALGGREDSARSVLTQIDEFTGTLDTNKADIVAAIESLNQLSLSVSRQLPDIDAALEELPSALTSIDAQRADLVEMLQALDDLSDVGVSVISQSKQATVASLRQLQPVLTQLANSGDSFTDAFNVFYAYPFVDEVVGRDPQVARNLHFGDYTNLSAQLDIDLSQTLGILDDLPLDLLGVTLDNVQACIASGDPLSEACTGLVGNQVLKDYCARDENRSGAFCTNGVIALLLTDLAIPGGDPNPPTTPTLPKAPKAPKTPSLPLGSGTQQQQPQQGGTPQTPANPLEDVPVIGQLFRPATGAWSPPRTDGKGGPTMGQLSSTYDPALVALLVPGMVAS